MQSYDILVLGELNTDLILRGDVEPEWGQVEKWIDDATLTLGSSSAIFACGAARLGLRVAMAAIVGDDMFGHFCKDFLAARGVDTVGVVVDPQQRTGMTIILQKPEDRAMLTFAGAISALSAAQISSELMQSARHIHVGSFFMQTSLQRDLPHLFADARRRGATTSLDPGWDPASHWEPLIELLPEVDILLPNEAEACALAEQADWRQALTVLAKRVPTVALKRGKDGAAAARGDEVVEASPPPVQVVDAVGAGDSFGSGFVYGALAGWPLERALRLGVACGSLSTRAAGGTSAQPTLEEALGEVISIKQEQR